MLNLIAQVGVTERLALYSLPIVGSVSLAFGIYQLVFDLRKSEGKRVEQRLRGGFSGGSQADRNEQSARESIMRQQRAAASVIASNLSKLSFVPAMQSMIDQANLPWIAANVMINLIGFAAATYIAMYMTDFGVAWSLVGAVLAFILPIAYIHFRRRRRLNKFLHQLPDVFELMGQGLRAGHSLANSLHLVSQQMSDPVGTEFARVFHEQNLGIRIEDALTAMAGRVGLMDVKFFVTAVVIQRTTGGDLAEVLDNISGVIRERIKLFGQVKALTAEGRLSGYVLFALPFVVFAMEQVINPEYGRILLDEEIGRYMLTGAVVMQLLGLALIKKIVNIKV